MLRKSGNSLKLGNFCKIIANTNSYYSFKMFLRLTQVTFSVSESPGTLPDHKAW